MLYDMLCRPSPSSANAPLPVRAVTSALARTLGAHMITTMTTTAA